MIGTYYVTVGILLGIYVLLAVGLNIITGYAGQASLGHAAFFGIGAYATAILTTTYGVSFWMALPAATLTAAVAGAALGALSLRVRDDFLAITTLGVNFVVVAVFLYLPFFGGALGIGGIHLPTIGARQMSKPEYFLLVLACTALGLLADRLLYRSWAGFALAALRDDELGAASLGIPTAAYKVLVFVIGTAYAGLAGVLYAHYITFITPQDFGFILSITVLCMIVLGGVGTLRGAVAGALLLGAVPELFRFLRDYRMLMYGALLMLLMRFQPQGLLGTGSWARRRDARRGTPRTGITRYTGDGSL